MKIGRIFLRGKTKAEGQVLFSQSMIGMVLLSFTENAVQTLKGICLFTGGHILFESSHTYFLKFFFFFSIYPIRDHQLYYNYINIIYKCLFKFLDFVLFICKQQKKTRHYLCQHCISSVPGCLHILSSVFCHFQSFTLVTQYKISHT